MKIGTRITPKNLPRCNGRPQLWYSDKKVYDQPSSLTGQGEEKIFDRIRILMPNGKVSYIWSASRGVPISGVHLFWDDSACTSAHDGKQKTAQLRVLSYSERPLGMKTFFMGYL